MEPKIWVFFYGAYINFSVLREIDLIPEEYRVATLSGYKLNIGPTATLSREPGGTVWGIIATATHDELRSLYVDHARIFLGGDYFPRAVTVTDTDDNIIPALCYICADMKPVQAKTDYIEQIARPAEEYGFPRDYIKMIRSFAPADDTAGSKVLTAVDQL